jgi:hypothetical protein
MLAAGVPIPINCDHSDQARDVVGYVKQFKLDGDRLLALCQFIGSDAALTAARNSVSVGINPDFIDGQARNWGEAIVHLALTPVPVVPDQGQFIAASQKSPESDTLVLSNEATPDQVPQTTEIAAVVCTAEQLAQLQQLISGGEDLTPDDCIARIIQFLQDPSDEDDEEDDEDEDENENENEDEDEDTETADDADDTDSHASDQGSGNVRFSTDDKSDSIHVYLESDTHVVVRFDGDSDSRNAIIKIYGESKDRGANSVDASQAKSAQSVWDSDKFILSGSSPSHSFQTQS